MIRYGSDVYRFIFAARERTAQADRSFREAVSTFRRMSLREAAQVKPTRVAVVTVGARDTVDSLAKRMAVPDHALETFRVLNGLTREDKLKPGERVKIVVE